MFNQEAMQNMMWGFIGEQVGKLPPELKQGLTQVEIDVVRYPDRLLIVVKAPETNPNAVQAGRNLLDGLGNLVPEYVSKVFKVKVRIFEK
jgi:hypothetical protein